MDEVAGFVMDAAVPGSGKTFDWDLLQKLPSTEKQVYLPVGLIRTMWERLWLPARGKLMVWTPVPV